MISQLQSVVAVQWGGVNEPDKGALYIGARVPYSVADDDKGNFQVTRIRAVDVAPGLVTLAIGLAPDDEPDDYPDPEFAGAFTAYRTIINPVIVVDYEVLHAQP